MKNFQFVFLRLSIYLVTGILLAFYIKINLEILFISGGGFLSLFLFAFYRARTRLFPDAIYGIATFLLITFLGFFTAFFAIPENQSSHYINQNIEQTDSLILSGRISEELKPTEFSKRFIIDTENLILKDGKRPIKGKVLLNLYQDSTHTLNLSPGKVILMPWTPERIKEPLNPFKFNYRQYMNQLKVERQLNLDVSKISIIDYKPNLQSKAWNIREHLILKLKRHEFGKDEIAVIQALILGQRRDISSKLYKDYAAAGAIHILAISGLHIGIILLLLNFIFKPVQKLKYGRIIKPTLIIIILWSFAFLTGLSASVVRAVFMFSFIAVGLQLKRKTSSLNSLFLSLFFLLLIDPYYIFQVGFQLSYLAVFSIIIFQPMIYGLLSPGNKIIDYFWKLTSVSLAAQIGVIPLSIFYFHQFPGLFLLSNLVVLPFLGILLILGIIVIFLASVQILPNIIEELFSVLLQMLNTIIVKIAEIDSFVISNIQLSLFQTISLYLVIISCIFLFRKISFERISFFLSAIIIFQLSCIYLKLELPKTESIIFHKSRKSIIGIKEQENFQIFSDEKIDTLLISDYLRERAIKNIETHKMPNVLSLSNKETLIIDTLGNYILEGFDPKIIVLRNSPKINLERLLGSSSPEQIIADGSNYYSYITRWKNTAEQKKIPFHYTGEKGAYIIKRGK